MNKSLPVLVATDVAARGIDVKDLDCVINFDLSPDVEVHTHRIGRVGRAGKKGKAYSFFSKKDQLKLESIAKNNKINIEKNIEAIPIHSSSLSCQPLMKTLRIEAGKKNKLRPGDILGALTSNDSLINASEIGKINIFYFYTLVAINNSKYLNALEHLSKNKIKGRSFKINKYNF